MYVFTMHADCADQFMEVLPEQLESAELVVEHLISQVLLGLFDTVILEDVSLLRSDRSKPQVGFLIHIYAHCANVSRPFLADHFDDLELYLEENICCALIELFGTVLVEEITVNVA